MPSGRGGGKRNLMIQKKKKHIQVYRKGGHIMLYHIIMLVLVWGRRGGAKTWTAFSERAARTPRTAERASFSWRANNGRRLKSIGSARRRPRGAVSAHIGIQQAHCINRMMCAYHTVHNNNSNNVRYNNARGVNAFWDLFHLPGAGGLPRRPGGVI